MACYHPIKGYRAKAPNPNGKYSIVFAPRNAQTDVRMDVPCGQCIGCKLERSRQWAMRLMHENQLHQTSSFLTLTYATENLPPHGTLVKKHFQDFMKRYRKWTSHNKLRFFHCGEYGENFGRPHYHAIIFGHEFADKEHKFTTKRGDKIYTSTKLNELWTHGLCSIGNVTFESAAYVARYVTKKITGPNARDHYLKINKQTGELLSERTPEYVTMSRRPGIGKSWFDKYTSDVFPHDEVVLRGSKMRPPKYYSTLYEKHHPDEMELIKERRTAAAKKPENTQHNTYERLRVREAIQTEKFNQHLKRNLK